MKTWLGWVLLGVWAVAIIAGLLFYSGRQLSWFDPTMRLSQGSASMTFDTQFADALLNQGAVPGSIVHFSQQARCFCDALTQPHHDVLAARLSDSHYRTASMNLDEHPSLQQFVPSTPAVAIIGFDGELRYFGPYATGYGCFTGNTLVNTIVRIAEQSALPGAVIASEAQGCFCAAPSTELLARSG